VVVTVTVSVCERNKALQLYNDAETPIVSVNSSEYSCTPAVV